MQLNLGDVETIDDPTVEDLQHHLRYLPAESPFVILDRDEDAFIQAKFDSMAGSYVVELKHEGKTYHRFANYEGAVRSFEAFLNGQPMADFAKWRRKTIFTTPNHPLVLTVLCVFMVAMIIFAFWPEVSWWLEYFW